MSHLIKHIISTIYLVMLMGISVPGFSEENPDVEIDQNLSPPVLEADLIDAHIVPISFVRIDGGIASLLTQPGIPESNLFGGAHLNLGYAFIFSGHQLDLSFGLGLSTRGDEELACDKPSGKANCMSLRKIAGANLMLSYTPSFMRREFGPDSRWYIGLGAIGGIGARNIGWSRTDGINFTSDVLGGVSVMVGRKLKD